MERRFQLHEDLFVETQSFSFGFNSRVIGVQPNQYLILDLPPDPPGSSQLQVDDTVRVNCFQPPIARFESRISQIISDPPMLLLEYPSPQSMHRADRRGEDRERMFLQATCAVLEDKETGEPFEGYILDISGWGCLILLDHPLGLGTEILLSFRIPWIQVNVEVKARVVYSNSTEKGNRCGLEFIEFDPESQARLTEFINFFKEM